MPAPRELDPTTSLAALYGVKLRRLRVGSGWTQRQLGDQVPVAHSRIAQYELGKESPPKDVCDALDRLLGAGGDLNELWEHVQRESIPDWARKYVELEARASVIRKYQAHTVPGLLQTAGYARALLTVARPSVGDRLENMVTTRLMRQDILNRAAPPVLWTLLDESVLYRPVGGAAVMCEQLRHVLEAMARYDRVRVQVLPYESGAQPLLGGSATVLSFPRRPDVVYLEGSHSGELVEQVGIVTEYGLAFEHVQAQALGLDESADLIRSVMEGSHRDVRIPTRPERRRVAQVQLQQHAGRRLRRGR
ncbi:helix-turn-helix domain-containing protein [Streptomyces silvensis]|uniref:XRE family transcriptional regulator n=1 Tax=Streptomyces silvensis TaxID=1765722 RepID=A0A0W7X4M9_9ACTN|nr:helix-turn-helix transcriptional regulator [Streptomyces silvensis]KUF17824.1 XRE family transcriptional regulator [Streptomyces silvensis]